jgi:hypothetical protein
MTTPMEQKEQQEQFDRLSSQLAEAKAGWDSCILDLRKAAGICKEAETRLAFVRDRAKTQSVRRITCYYCGHLIQDHVPGRGCQHEGCCCQESGNETNEEEKK